MPRRATGGDDDRPETAEEKKRQAEALKTYRKYVADRIRDAVKDETSDLTLDDVLKRAAELDDDDPTP